MLFIRLRDDSEYINIDVYVQEISFGGGYVEAPNIDVQTQLAEHVIIHVCYKIMDNEGFEEDFV